MDLWLPPKPAIIIAKPPELVRPGDPRFETAGALPGIGGVRSKKSATGNDTFTKLLLHCDGADTSTTFTDVSLGGAHGTATVTGNAQVDTAQSVFGGASLLSDPTGDYVKYANHADWNLSGDFTIDYRVRYASINASINGNIAANGNTGWAVYQAGTSIRVWNGAGTDRGVSFTPALNTWYHIAVVRAGTTVTFYKDGTSLGTAGDGDFNNDGAELFIAGYAADGFGLNGWMDEIRISNGIARWTSNFTPPTSAYG